MRISILIAAALPLAACGGGGTVDNNALTADGGSEQVTAVNDTTAIDAATGQAANMAADVNYMMNEQALNESDNRSESKKPSRTSEPKAETPVEPDEPDSTADTNTAG